MAEKRIVGRAVQKHDVEKNWQKATNFTPMAGEVIIYDRDDNVTDESLRGVYYYERIKIGDGVTNVNALPFVDDSLRVKIIDLINEVDEKTDNIGALVGDISVSDQIEEALLNSQDDWDQNDNTKPDYIKNRPFYSEDPVEVAVLENTTLDFNSEDAYGGDFSVYLDVDLLSKMELGVEYVINWNGVEYMRTSFVDNYQLVVGNAALNAGEDTGEPFLIIFAGDATATIHVDRSNRTTHTVSITAVEVNVHKIDSKYIPNNAFIGDFGINSSAEIFNDYENNTASGSYSHAQGTKTTASGYTAHAQNYETVADGDYAHAEGNRTTATGEAAHSEGYLTTAIGDFSHSEGYGTSADSAYQHVQGKYNIKDTERKYLHIVGNGTDYLNRANAHTIDWDGNSWFAGDVYVGGSNQDDAERLVKFSELLEETTVDDTLTQAGQSADAKVTGDAISAINALVGDTPVSEQINSTVSSFVFDCIKMRDKTNGYNYLLEFIDGQLVSSCCCASISISSLPEKTTYIEGESLDTSGIVVTAICEDGSVKNIENYTTSIETGAGNKMVSVIYTECGTNYTATFPVTVTSIEDVLIDFEYAAEDDGTYTITGWKGTLNGVASTECIIPDNALINV